MFVGRKLDELPDSTGLLVDAIKVYNITHLYMSDNAFGPNGVVKFNKQLAAGFFSLTHLHLLNCGLGPEGTEMVADALRENGAIKLKCLFISRNRVEDKGAKALARYFKEYNQLNKLLIY
jgi:Ran GTPase-activating protein (RanGAP) involved in mRNA processing and transport